MSISEKMFQQIKSVVSKSGTDFSVLPLQFFAPFYGIYFNNDSFVLVKTTLRRRRSTGDVAQTN